MAFKPEVSIGVGLATAAVVWAVYSNATPSLADIRAGEPGDGDIDVAERQASWTAAGIVGGISLIAKDPTVFIIGGFMVVAMAWHTRHANHTDPRSGQAANYADPSELGMMDAQDMAEGMPSYGAVA